MVVPHDMTMAPDCSMSNDTLGRLVFNCTGHHFATFPANIPINILVLILRRTMISPKVPSFQAIGLENLQVLDLSWNSINHISDDTFKDMTSLLSLDVRGNQFVSIHVPDGLFNSLINLRLLQIDGTQFVYNSSKNFINVTKSLKSLESFSYYHGKLKFAIEIASHFTNITSLVFKVCNNTEFITLAQTLNQLQNLTKLIEISIINCQLFAVGNISLGWMSNVRNINLACNFLNIEDTVKFLGSQSSLSQIDTLILDRLDRSFRIVDCTSGSLNSNIFCNISFAHSLRRLSIQQIGVYNYEASMIRCLPNLRSISMGHNIFNSVLNEGHEVLNQDYLNIVFQGFKSLYYIKASFLQVVGTTKDTYCYSDDSEFNQYFIDESEFQIQPSACEHGNFDIRHGYIKLPSCLRVFQLDHFQVSGNEQSNLPPIGINVASNNSLEVIDLSFSVFEIDGLFINGLSFSGLHKLRSLKFRHMNIKRFYMVTLNHADNLKDIDLSDNRFEKMTGEQVSNMFTKPLNIHSLNLSASDLVFMNPDFLRQFPRITLLDLSYNKLSQLSCNLSWLISNNSLTMDFSFNQISTLSDIFVESVKKMEQYRSITLHMTNNPFRCDCDTLAFLRWFQSTRITIAKKSSITCTYRGVDIAFLSTVDITNLEYQCTKFIRVLYISIGSVLSLTAVSLLLGVILFKYRWHIRWHWFRVKRNMFRDKGLGHESPQMFTEHDFACFVNYFGVTGEWIMREIVTPIENFIVGDVFIYERNGLGGLSSSDAIMDTINNSKMLLYVAGNELNAGDQSSFFLSLQLAAVERLSDIIFVYKEVAVFELLQKKTSLLRPNRKSPIKLIQYEANDMFWNEMQQYLNSNRQDD